MTLPPLLGVSPAIRQARDLIRRFATSRLSILLVAPTGSGKDLLAQHIHASSGRRGRMVALNCAALPREMADSLLFGHRRGAFSGAVETRRGHVAQAHGGTLFLDELLSLPVDVQPKLLRTLDSGEIHPLAEECVEHVDVRVVAAGQDEIGHAIQHGGLRKDLYHRLAGVIIRIPPLEARTDDIPPLAEYFAGLQGRTLEDGALPVLRHHPWPGNVRELRDVIARAGGLVDNGTLPPAALAEAIALGNHPDAEFGQSPLLANAERQRILETCERLDWDGHRVAPALGMSRTTLWRRLRAFGVSLRCRKTFQRSVTLQKHHETLKHSGEGEPA